MEAKWFEKGYVCDVGLVSRREEANKPTQYYINISSYSIMSENDLRGLVATIMKALVGK